MARAHLRFNVVDATGKVVQNAAVSVRKPATTTPITDTMYVASTGGSTLPNPLISNAQGEVEAYVDVPGTDVPGSIDLLIEDNAQTAYYPDAQLVLITFTAYTETIEMRRAPDRSTAAFAVTNVTTDRTYDANATTTDELADVLGTLIADLRALGVIL